MEEKCPSPTLLEATSPSSNTYNNEQKRNNNTVSQSACMRKCFHKGVRRKGRTLYRRHQERLFPPRGGKKLKKKKPTKASCGQKGCQGQYHKSHKPLGETTCSCKIKTKSAFSGRFRGVWKFGNRATRGGEKKHGHHPSRFPDVRSPSAPKKKNFLVRFFPTILFLQKQSKVFHSSQFCHSVSF